MLQRSQDETQKERRFWLVYEQIPARPNYLANSIQKDAGLREVMQDLIAYYTIDAFGRKRWKVGIRNNINPMVRNHIRHDQPLMVNKVTGVTRAGAKFHDN